MRESLLELDSDLRITHTMAVVTRTIMGIGQSFTSGRDMGTAATASILAHTIGITDTGVSLKANF